MQYAEQRPSQSAIVLGAFYLVATMPVSPAAPPHTPVARRLGEYMRNAFNDGTKSTY
jgi:hypothetical protein